MEDHGDLFICMQHLFQKLHYLYFEIKIKISQVMLRKTKEVHCQALPLFNGIQQSIILQMTNENSLASK